MLNKEYNQPTVSVIIPCRNEKHYINRCLDSIIKNGYPQNLLEVIIADGFSDDGTREIIHQYSQKYKFIFMIDNPKRHLVAALNLCIKKSTGDIIVRLDGHTTMTPNYISKCIETLEKYDAANVGGIIQTIPSQDTVIANAIAYSISHPFGVGLSHYRLAKKNKVRIVDTVPFGCFRRDLFSKIGYFDEELVRVEDIDFNLRLKKAGEKIVLNPEIVSCYYSRATFNEFWKHNFANGILITEPLAKNKINFSARHVTPLLFLLGLVMIVILSFFSWHFKWLLGGLIGFYLCCNFYFSLKAAVRKKNPAYLFVMPLMFSSLHLSYGLGSLYGLWKALVNKIKRFQYVRRTRPKLP